MKNSEFNIPFIHSMVIIATATLIAMASSRYFVEKYLYPEVSHPVFTSQNFQSHSISTNE